MMRLRPLCVCMFAVSGCLPVFCLDACMFRGNPQHSGIYDSPAVAKAHVKWSSTLTAS
jgi:hypothetical protein